MELFSASSTKSSDSIAVDAIEGVAKPSVFDAKPIGFFKAAMLPGGRSSMFTEVAFSVSNSHASSILRAAAHTVVISESSCSKSS